MTAGDATPALARPAGILPIDYGGPKPVARVHRPGGHGPSLVVLYDRDCGLCTASARQLRRWDRHGRLELLSLQDATGPAAAERPRLAAAIAGLPLLTALHVYEEGSGAIRAGGAAALAIGAVLPGGAIVRVLSWIPPVRWSVDLGYRLVARQRRRIGRWLRLEGPSCDVPA